MSACAVCGNDISGEKVELTTGECLHNDCAKCFECKIDCKDGVISEYHGDNIYMCQEHYELRLCPVCDACKSIVKSRDDEITLFARHFHKNCVRCVSCNSLIHSEDEAVVYLNGFLCTKCPAPKLAWEAWPAPPGGH